MKKLVYCLILALVGWSGLDAVGVGAQTPPSLSINLVLNKNRYILNLPGDPINAQLTVRNTGTAPIVTSAGFSTNPFHLLLGFTDPNGKGIFATELQGGGLEPLPPNVVLIDGALVQVEQVEILPVGFVKTINIPDVRQYYSLLSAGNYSVQTIVPVRTYNTLFTVDGANVATLDSVAFAGAIQSNTLRFSLVTDADNDKFFSDVDCDDNDASVNPDRTEVKNNGKDDDCNPATLDTVSTAAQELKVVVDTLTKFVANNPKKRFTDELQRALIHGRGALADLTKMPPNNKKAVDRIEAAVEMIGQAVREGFSLNDGRNLMNQFAGVARHLAVDAINQAIAQNGKPMKIKKAQQELAKGDIQRQASHFGRAVERYDEAREEAEEAVERRGRDR